jgi:hypothetical protein
MKFLPNLGLPTAAQWIDILKVFGWAFVSTTLAVFTVGGGISTEWQATMTLGAASLVAGINAGLYALYTTFFKKAE